MKEDFTLTQTHDDNDRRVTKSGTINRKIVKFATITLGDEIEIQIMIRGSKDAMKARFGTWAFGLFPDPAQVEVSLGTVGTNATLKLQTPAPVATATATPDPDPVDKVDLTDLDDLSSRLDDI